MSFPFASPWLSRLSRRIAGPGSRLDRPREHVEPGRRVVDPSQVSLQAVDGVVGEQDVERWLTEPAPPEPDLQSELFAKVVLALLLDRPAGRYLDLQRAAHLQRMRELTEL